MAVVTYSYDHVTRHQTLVERRWILPDSPHRPSFAGSQDDYTPFGGSGDTLKRRKVLGGSLRVWFGQVSDKDESREEMESREEEMEVTPEVTPEGSPEVEG